MANAGAAARRCDMESANLTHRERTTRDHEGGLAFPSRKGLLRARRTTRDAHRRPRQSKTHLAATTPPVRSGTTAQRQPRTFIHPSLSHPTVKKPTCFSLETHREGATSSLELRRRCARDHTQGQLSLIRPIKSLPQPFECPCTYGYVMVAWLKFLAAKESFDCCEESKFRRQSTT